MRVTRGGLNLVAAVVDLHQGAVEGPSTHVANENDLAFGRSGDGCAVRNGRGRGFVDQTNNFKTGHLCGRLGGLPLKFIEGGRYCEHDLLN
mmetsp:Transcript_54446/g.116305  ORF Transcript_54446/g.116305 Transcript_54446/m.116305 type:complete len:91 (-) Transcript_54446:507-779(-)